MSIEAFIPSLWDKQIREFAFSKPFNLKTLKEAANELMDIAWNVQFFKLHGEYPVLDKIKNRYFKLIIENRYE